MVGPCQVIAISRLIHRYEFVDENRTLIDQQVKLVNLLRGSSQAEKCHHQAFN
jgi:hypothetical protein